jgi:hypothetical protein
MLRQTKADVADVKPAANSSRGKDDAYLIR